MDVSLQDALDSVLVSNLELQVERVAPQIVKQDIREAQGSFDPVLSLGLNYEDAELPLTRQLAAASGGLAAIRTKDLEGTGGLEGRTSTGTEYRLELLSSRQSNTFNFFDPEYQQTARAVIVQPLFKDNGRETNTAFIRLAKNRYHASKLDFEHALMDVLSAVELAYWDFVFANDDLAVKRESLKLAKSLLRQSRAKARAGVLSDLEVIQAQAGVAFREEALLMSAQRRLDEENRLKKLIFGDFRQARPAHLHAADRPRPARVSLNTLERIRTALERRRDLQQLKIEAANQNILVKYERNQELPRIDLEGTAGLNGLGGGYGGSWEDLSSLDHPVYGAGVAFKVPLGNEAASARHHKAKARSRQILLRLKALENDIVYQIETSTSSLQTAWKRIRKAKVSLDFAGKALEAEQKKFNAGVSTSHDILDFEEDLAVAKSNYLKAQIDYVKAAVELDRLQGTSLERYRYELEIEDS